MALVNIGFGSFVSSERLVSVLSPDSAPIKRMVQDARERGALIDASYGRKTRSVLVTDGGYIILSALDERGRGRAPRLCRAREGASDE